MRRNDTKHVLAAKFCLLLLGALLLLAACGGGYQSPGPNSTPSNGYNIIYIFEHGMPIVPILHMR